MSNLDPSLLKCEFDRLSTMRHMGRVSGVARGVIEIQGLEGKARIGDHLTLRRGGASDLPGEVLHVEAEVIHMLPTAAPDGVSLGDQVILNQTPAFAPGLHWLGRVVDPFGRPLDGKPLLPGMGS